MRVTYNKLVRDRIPEIIQSQGHRAVTHVLDDESYRAALLAKLVEEAQEAREASVEELPAELADVLEVLRALTSSYGMTWEQLLALTTEKCAQRGAFEERVFLEFVEPPEISTDPARQQPQAGQHRISSGIGSVGLFVGRRRGRG